MLEDKPLILIVDDEDDARTCLFSLLDSEGFSCATCPGAYQALEFISHHRPALVISDVRMPDIDGMELLAKIRYMSPNTRVIMYSAYGDWPLFLETLEKGGADLIPKGASNAQILSVVRRVLQGAPK